MDVRLSLFIFFELLCPTISFLDIDELKNTHYGIDILSKPVVMQQHSDPSSVYLTSKFGQSYQCTLPFVETREKIEDEEREAVEIGIPELLRPMQIAPCLIKTKDWWTYEFCYGKYIRQYHEEDGKIMSAVMYLGNYESEFDWNEENNKEATKRQKSQLNKYHSQQYVNGSNCDLTGKPRRAEVRFLCEEGSGDSIAQVSERETCVYMIIIHTTRICHHPYLKPAKMNKPLPITCNPLVTEDQYEAYLHEQQEEQKLRELTAILEQQRLYKMKQKELAPPGGPTIHLLQEADYGASISLLQAIDHLKDKLSSLLTDELSQQALEEKQDSEYYTSAPHTDDTRSGMGSEAGVQHAKQLEKDAKTLDTDPDKHPDSSNDDVASTSSKDTESQPSTSSSGVAIDEHNTDTDKTLAARVMMLLKERKKIEKLNQYKEELKNLLDKYRNFMDDDDAAVAFREQIVMLEKMVEATMNPDIKDDNTLDSDKHPESLSEDVAPASSKATQTQSSSSSSSSQESTDEQNADTDKNASPTDAHKAPVTEVEIRAWKLHSKKTRPADDNDIDDDEDDDDNAASPVILPAKQKAEIEEILKKKLRDQGVETGGQKVQVKIITAAYLDDDGETVQVLSDIDSDVLTRVLAKILGSSRDEENAKEKYKQLESNYGLVWDKRKAVSTDHTLAEHSSDNDNDDAED